MTRSLRSRARRAMAVALAVGLLLVACGSDDDAGSGESSATTDGGVTETSIAEGGTLRIATAMEPVFNPYRWDYGFFQTIENLYDGMIEFDENRQPVPALATEWEMAPDNASVTITLRDDVTYHSGTPMTAESVLPTIATQKDPKTGGLLTGVFGVVSTFEAVDTHTVKLGFTQPVREEYVWEILENFRPVDPAKMPEVLLNTAEGGTGPFTMVSTAPGGETRLVAYDGYWREDEPILDEVIFVKYSDRDAAIASLESGEVDLMWPATAAETDRLVAQGYQVEPEQSQTAVISFRLNPNKAPFDNKLARQAMQYVVDRQSMAEAVFSGYATPKVLPWNDDNIATDPDLVAEYSFDLDRARELFDESGLSDDQLAFTMVVDSSQPELVLTMQRIQSDLREIGVDMTLQPVDTAALIVHITNGDFQALGAPTSFAQRFPTFINGIGLLRADANNALWRDKIPPAYVEAMRRANDPTVDLDEALGDLAQVLLDESWNIWICDQPSYIQVYTDDVGGHGTLQDSESFMQLRQASIQQ